MIIEVKNEDVYIPDYRNNIKDLKSKGKVIKKKLDEGEQIKVNHRFTTPGERQKYIYTKDVKVDKLKGTVDGKVESVMDLTGLTKAIVTSIDNYSIRKDGKEIKIDTVDKLYDTQGVDESLVARIETGMLIASPEVDADFLSRPSAST